MATLTIPSSHPMLCAVDAIRRETRHSEVTAFKVRDGLIHVEYERKPQCDPRST